MAETQVDAAGDPISILQQKNGIRSGPRSGRASTVRAAGTSTERRRRLARAAAQFVFASMIFLVGLFIGAFFSTDLATLPRPEISVSLRLPRDAPASPAVTAVATVPDSKAAATAPGTVAATKVASAPTTHVDAASATSPDAAKPGALAVGTTAGTAGEVLTPHAGDGSETTTTPAPSVQPTSASAVPDAGPRIVAPPSAGAAAAQHAQQADIAALTARGDALLSAGDVTSARLFYRRGADAGDSAAALRLGETYDPAFLDRAHLGRVAGDLNQALHWYRHARDLGSAEAEVLLRGTAGSAKK